MDWTKKHIYRTGSQTKAVDELPPDDQMDAFASRCRRDIEPWLAAVFQAEHLNLLAGSGLTLAVANLAKTTATGMGTVQFGSDHDAAIDTHATTSAKKMGRGKANVEDQFRSAFAVLDGLEVTDAKAADKLRGTIASQLATFLQSLLKSEQEISTAPEEPRRTALTALESFLLSFASRAASRERLHIFTTNYDRLIEHGCDQAGLRTIDRFVGALNPVFRAQRVEIDVHYNPPGIRGEPRYMEGVVRLSKLHGSLDWHYDAQTRRIAKKGIPFGAPSDHSDMPKNPLHTVMVYPNAAKDVETTQYPYAELFRDFAAAVCRPNAVVVTYGYGFGDDHINRVLVDMLTIPSTHLVIIANSASERLQKFCQETLDAQVTLLIGSHFGNLGTLVEHYLPKPALDSITTRMAVLMKNRGGQALEGPPPPPPADAEAPPAIDPFL